MNLVQKIGLTLFSISLLCFMLSLSMSNYKLSNEILLNTIDNKEHYRALKPRLNFMLNKEYENKSNFIHDFNSAIKAQNESYRLDGEWDKVIWTDYSFNIVKNSSTGFLIRSQLYLLLFIFLGGALGALMYILPQAFESSPEIKNNDIYKNSATSRGGLGVVIGLFLIAFYVLLYWFPEYISNWAILVDPLSMALSGKPASQWFLYGLMYSLVMVVMGTRMMIKYRHNRYQMIRTISVVFFQLSFAFLIPEILLRLNQPYYDFKNIWPLDYDFFFEWNLNTLIDSGGLGLFMLVWGIVLILFAVPILVYFFGKRWYCSWVCGCGGLAETLGDPFRQLSNKSLGAWKVERFSVHFVLVFAVVMTGLTLYTYFSGEAEVMGLNTYDVQKSYGFLIGAVFSGIVGTGFYPFMGNRVWCRFGCPLAAYLGIVQRFKSRFRISTNGGQCISCGNCSTYCEMGIDVRWYAQRGQNIVRSSCVGCGICSAVCPRGVLNLENGPEQNRVKEVPFLLGNDGLRLKDQIESAKK